jgi:hypothetical protein
LSMCFHGLILLVVDVCVYWQAANATALAVWFQFGFSTLFIA